CLNQSRPLAEGKGEQTMQQETPMLMITLMVPLQADISSDQIIEVIGQQLTQAIAAARQQQQAAEGTELSEDEIVDEAAPAISTETFESYSEDTKDDLLSKLGYGVSEN